MPQSEALLRGAPVPSFHGALRCVDARPGHGHGFDRRTRARLPRTVHPDRRRAAAPAGSVPVSAGDEALLFVALKTAVGGGSTATAEHSHPHSDTWRQIAGSTAAAAIRPPMKAPGTPGLVTS